MSFSLWQPQLLPWSGLWCELPYGNYSALASSSLSCSGTCISLSCWWASHRSSPHHWCFHISWISCIIPCPQRLLHLPGFSCRLARDLQPCFASSFSLCIFVVSLVVFLSSAAFLIRSLLSLSPGSASPVSSTCQLRLLSRETLCWLSNFVYLKFCIRFVFSYE